MKTLDLHGVRHADVPKLLDQFLWEQIQKKRREAEIITGISHSINRAHLEVIAVK